jgi:hypothetical protein
MTTRSPRKPLPLLPVPVVIVIALCAASCEGESQTSVDVPSWLQAEIARLDAEAAPNVPVVVTRSQYRGETVFYASPSLPDGLGVLFDAEGNVLCHPDGGLDGRGDGKCTDFFAARVNETVLWRAAR